MRAKLNLTATSLEPHTYHQPGTKELQFDALASQIPVVLLCLNEKLKITWANEAFPKILGYTTDEIEKLSCGLVSILLPQERKRCLAWLRSVISGHEKPHSTHRFRIIHKDGTILFCLFKPYFASTQETPPYGKLVHFMIVDETDRVLLEECSLKDQRLKNLGAMAAEIAHEIKNSIIAIGGFARRLRKIMPSNTEVKIIEAESGRLERLVRSINGYIRPGQSRNSQQPVAKILDQSLLLMAPELKGRRITVKLLIQDLPKTCTSDKDALCEVFVNLIRNAVEALEPGGCLTVKAGVNGPRIYIEFENLMEKKSVKDPAKLFQSIEEGGTSIGLPLSFRIVKSLGGHLSFEKRGHLAIFRIELPNNSR